VKETGDGLTKIQVAQFQVPTTTPTVEEQAPTQQVLKKDLKFEYVLDTEVEIPYRRNADLDSRLRDNSLIVMPSLFGRATYRAKDWLETKLLLTLEKQFAVHEENIVTLPDGSLQRADPKPWSLYIDEMYARFKPSSVPIEFTLGRRNFEDARRWLYDETLDAAILTLKPGDFHIEASVSRLDWVDLDLIAEVPRGKIDNYLVYAEYRGIEDHKLAGYWFLREDNTRLAPGSDAISEEGEPQFMGFRAYGRPSDAFNYWTEFGYLGGKDEFARDFSGAGALDVGGTYRFLDAPLQPSVTLGFRYGSGDRNPDDNKNSEFRQTGLQTNEQRFGGVTQFITYGEVFNPELSNLKIFTAGLGLRPKANFFIDLVYHRYWLNEFADEVRGQALTAEMNQLESRLSTDVGSELDIILGIRNLFGVRGFGFEARGGVFFPGAAFDRSDGREPDLGTSVLIKFVY